MLTPYKMAYQPAPISVSSLNYDANNQYRNFPPKMSDSRSLVSSFQPVSVVDYYLKDSASATNNWSYREYLKNNANNIEKEMQRKSLNDVGYYQRYINDENVASPAKIMPYSFTSLFDNSRPLGYQNSDTKQSYLSREQLNARLMMPRLTQ